MKTMNLKSSLKSIAVLGKFMCAVIAISVVSSHSEATPPGRDVRGEVTIELEPEFSRIEIVPGDLVEVKTVTSTCPSTARRCRTTSYQVAVIQFTLGCLNDVIVAGSHVEKVGTNDYNLHISALELVNSKSDRIRCIAANKKRVEIPLQISEELPSDSLSLVFSPRIYVPKRAN